MDRWLFRILLYLVIASLIFTTGKVLVDVVSDIFNGVVDGVAGFFKSIGDSIGGMFRSIGNLFMGYDSTITYALQEDVTLRPDSALPEAQPFRGGSHPRISDVKPSRPGYHFTGWTWHKNSNDPLFYAGEKTGLEVKGDTTLYPCWVEFKQEDPCNVFVKSGTITTALGFTQSYTAPHNYNVVETEHGLCVRLLCDCGYEVIDYNMSRDYFVYLRTGDKNKKFEDLSDDEQASYKRSYVLYCAQHYAPAVINMIGAFYNSMASEREGVLKDFATAEDILEMIENGAKIDAKCAKKLYGTEEYVELVGNQRSNAYTGETLSYLLKKMQTADTYKEERMVAKEVFEDFEDHAQYATEVLSAGRALFYLYDAATNPSGSAVDSATSMVKSIHAIVSFCPYVGDYYDQLFTLLEEGMVLCREFEKIGDRYSAFLEGCSDDQSMLIGLELTVLDVSQASVGNFTKVITMADGSKQEVDALPTVPEVLESLFGNDKSGKIVNKFAPLSKEEKTLVVWYLSMRLEFDLAHRYDITLDEYMSYIK